jgi:hypothetical protein
MPPTNSLRRLIVAVLLGVGVGPQAYLGSAAMGAIGFIVLAAVESLIRTALFAVPA